MVRDGVFDLVLLVITVVLIGTEFLLKSWILVDVAALSGLSKFEDDFVFFSNCSCCETDDGTIVEFALLAKGGKF